MDLKLRRKEIRERHFSTGGLILVSFLGVVGIFLVFLSGVFDVTNLKMLYDCVFKNGIVIIFGTFFFLVALYCWILFFLNVIVKPKKEILYLYENYGGELYFINRKGKRFDYDFDKRGLKDGQYYHVLRTHNYVYEVMEKTNESWIPREKKSYWLNFYSPAGNFENIFLLPIAYVILLPGVLSFLMSKGYQKIFGAIISAAPLYIIVYDLIYKIKLKKSDNNVIDDTKFLKFADILKKGITVIPIFLICLILISLFLRSSDFITKLIFLPFLGCALCSLGLVLSQVFEKYKLAQIFLKGYIVIFLTYWFGFLSFWTIGIIKQEGNYIFALFSIPFWIAGFAVMYKYLIKNK